VELDFEPEVGLDDSLVAIKDVFLGVKEVPLLGYVRLGNQKEPFGLENITSTRYVQFLELGLPKALSSSFGTGAVAMNHSQDEALTWSFGVFFNDLSENIKERVGDSQGINGAVRATWSPWYEGEGRYLLHLGGGYEVADDRDNAVQFATRPEVHENAYFVDTGLIPVEWFQRANVEAAVVLGPLSLQAELFWLGTRGIAPTPDMDFYGAYAFVSYFLTGENRAYRRTRGVFYTTLPNTNFWLIRTAQGPSVGWGAWEVSARWSFVDLDAPGLTAPSRGELHDTTLGLNWYWTPQIRAMLNWIHAFGNRADVGRNEADILSMRMQFDF
jgi:phosphate-selective porin OprO/OprP